MYQAYYQSPLGHILIKASDSAITYLVFSEPAEPENKNVVIETCFRELDAYFAGKLKEFSVSLTVSGTDFRLKVWEALRHIPYGTVISYKNLAENTGNPKAVRAVGGANHHNPISIIIPCHRVIGADGSLTGYGGGPDMKERLLLLENSSTIRKEK